MTGSSCVRAQAICRVSTFLHLLPSLTLLSVFAHGQCTAPAAGAAVPAAPVLDAQILLGASYATGTGIPGDTVVICVDGNATTPASTATIRPNGSFQLLINAKLTEGQQITAQQYTPGAAPVYST